MTRRNYFFVIKKCGSSDCDMCSSPCLPSSVFSEIHVLPDPMPGYEGHYKRFADVYGTTTDESHCPSLQKRSLKAKTLPLASSLKHVKNVDMMLECEHCGRWWLLYCQQKLTKKERKSLQEALANVSFTCGVPLQELELPGKLANVYVRDISCEEPIE